MLSKAFDTKQTTLTFLVNIKKIIKKKKIDDLTVFEPKNSLEGCYDGTDFFNKEIIRSVRIPFSIFVKRIHNVFQIRGDKTQRQQNS